jgi:hypothetical protein
MFRSWANAATRRFANEGKISKFRGLDAEAAQELLAVLDAPPRLLT